jgi:SAM-dependent methyltransferase
VGAWFGSGRTTTEALRDRVARLNRVATSYHKFDLGRGLVIEGDYDIAKYIDHYGIPPSLKGSSVLDVGTASGALAVECARRGADVTAIDLWEGSEALDVFDLDDSLGTFDLVICGSMLLHVASPLDALRKMRSVCHDRVIVSTTCPADSATNDRPVCDFLGIHASDGDYWHYWTISAAALTRMLLAAGFVAIGESSHFVLQTEPGRAHYVSPHVVVTARV